jgi:hypothetical protein
MIDKNWKNSDRLSLDLQYMDFTINCVKIKNSIIQLRIVSVGYAVKKCERYHIVNCVNRTKTITEYSKE